VFGSKVKVNVKSFLAPGLSEKLLSEKEYVKWLMKSWLAVNVKVTMAVSFPLLPTIADACKVFGCPLTGCGLSGFGPRYSSPMPAWINGGRLKTSSAAKAKNASHVFELAN